MNKHAPVDELIRIRGLMERSTRFQNLSGISGMLAGLLALAAVWIAARHLDWHGLLPAPTLPAFQGDIYRHHVLFLTGVALVVLVLAFAQAVWFTWRKRRKAGHPLWDPSAKRLLINLMIPLFTGGIFCLALIFNGSPALVPAAMLIFYGLGLLNASKYTLEEVRWLGMGEILLGLMAAFWTGAGLLLWATGFGVLHILYGALIYMRYEWQRATAQ